MTSEDPILNHRLSTALKLKDGQLQRYSFSENSWKIAALKGDFEVIKHLQQFFREGFRPEVIDILAERHHFDNLRFLTNDPILEESIIKASEYARRHCL